MLQTIVVPLDGSTFSARAVPAAMTIGRAGKANLRLVGIAGSEAEAGPLHRHLESTAELVAPDGPPAIVQVIIDGDPVGALQHVAAEPGTVLCFASHDHLPIPTAIMHHVGSTLIDHTEHSYIVVGNGMDGAIPLTSHDIVVAVDGVEAPEPLLAVAAAWSRQLQAPLRVVNVYEPVPHDIRKPDHYTRHHGPPGDPDTYLREVGRYLEETGVVPLDLTAIPDATSVADGLTRHLYERPTLLLIMGGRRPGPHATPGVLRHLLREMPLPVLVVHRW
jgi:nucleotide-binding universal stress UspA family protein